MSYLDFIKTEKVETAPRKTPGEIKTESQSKLKQFKRELPEANRMRATGWFYERTEVRV